MHMIDLNADVGEGGVFDSELLALVTTANIACGGHAGDIKTMWSTLEIAMKHEVAIGAHPSFVDKVDFGRRDMGVRGAQLLLELQRQMTDFLAVLRGSEGSLQHIKPHGALYNLAARDPEVADTLIELVQWSQQQVSREIFLYCQPGLILFERARVAGLQVVGEGFLDRRYQQDGTLVPRNEKAAVLTESALVLKQFEGMLAGAVEMDQGVFKAVFQSVCIHGDGPRAIEFTEVVVEYCLAQGVRLCSPVDVT